jgi:hypothetical protein
VAVLAVLAMGEVTGVSGPVVPVVPPAATLGAWLALPHAASPKGKINASAKRLGWFNFKIFISNVPSKDARVEFLSRRILL